MTKKCSGCGAYLQTENKEKIGYTNDCSSSFCERCFRINHYGEYKVVTKENEEFLKILREINKTKDLVLLVVDLFFLNEDFNIIKETLKENPILLVLTKRDLLPKSLYEEKLISYMDRFGFNQVDQIIIDYKNYHYDELLELIQKHKKSKNVYVVGYTNAGKSTMINHLIYHYSTLETQITTSMLPSTTLNQIEIPLLEDLTIIDTPGILEPGNILDYVDSKMIKKILPKKEVKPITYQMKTNTTFLIENVVKIDVRGLTNLTFFFSNSLRLERKYGNVSNLDSFVTYDFKITKPCDIVICGLGFFKVTKPCEIVVQTIPNVKVYLRDSLI